VFGVLAQTPKPQNPNPQSPIPNPQYFILKNIYLFVINIILKNEKLKFIKLKAYKIIIFI